jgi:hypothetical protein
MTFGLVLLVSGRRSQSSLVVNNFNSNAHACQCHINASYCTKYARATHTCFLKLFEIQWKYQLNYRYTVKIDANCLFNLIGSYRTGSNLRQTIIGTQVWAWCMCMNVSGVGFSYSLWHERKITVRPCYVACGYWTKRLKTFACWNQPN